MRLLFKSDLQSLAYLIAYPTLAYVQWRDGFSLLLYLIMVMISIGIGVIHHNHTHLPMWKKQTLNRLTSYWISLLQGIPSFVFFPAHIENHHRYNHGPLDEARTYRFGGDHNNLKGYLIHPFQSIYVLRKTLRDGLARDRQQIPKRFFDTMAQIVLIALSWIYFASMDLQKFTIFIFIPQLIGIHWLMSANYLQHAHADGHSKTNFARNFTGMINWMWFNIGFHTAHHSHPNVHWSKLQKLHLREKEISPALVEKSLLWYMLRTYFLSLIFLRFRSHSLMALPQHPIYSANPFVSPIK